MDVKKCSELPLSAGKNALHRFLIVAAVAWMYLSSIATLIFFTAVLKSSMDAGLTPQTWSLTHPHKKKLEVAIRGMQRPRDLQQSQNYSCSFE